MEAMHHNVAIDPGLVRAKAYEIWESLGRPDGAAEQTWFEAEQQLKSRSPEEPPASTATTQPKKSSASPRRTTRR